MTDERSDDRAEIIRVIEAETEAWLDADLAGWADCWVHEDYVRRMSARVGSGAGTVSGFDTGLAEVGRNMERFRERNMTVSEIRRENWNIRIGRDMAWATFDQITRASGNRQAIPGLHHQLRILERHDGRWRIACVSEVQTRIGFYTCPWVRVDGKARIIDMNPAAQVLLGGHRALTIVGGRLRGRTRPDTQLLRNALELASGEDGIYDYYGTRPLLFTHTEDGDFSICWLANYDAMLVILFDDEQLVERTLDKSREVFGLTEGQVTVARQIARGRDLAQVAAALGVRTTTVRTHVRRMFEKLGVNSQTALIRALLSVEGPQM